MLGHADIKTTSTYLNVTLPGLHESMRRFDEARNRCKIVTSKGHTEHRLSRNENQAQHDKTLIN